MTEIQSLGYLVIPTDEIDDWRSFLALFGVQEVPYEDGVRFRVDEREWRIAVDSSGTEKSVVAGLEVADRTALESVLERLARLGYRGEPSAELAKRRLVAECAPVADSDGNRFEIYWGARVARERFVSPTGARFVTGDQGLGHAVNLVTDMEMGRCFYIDGLGLRISDEIRTDLVGGFFLHANRRHHTYGFAVPPPQAPKGFSHFMLEVDDLDVVGRAYDAIFDGAAPLQLSLGRHSNDRMVSFYTVSPGGFSVEFGWGGRHIGDGWATTVYDTGSIWGHEMSLPINTG